MNDQINSTEVYGCTSQLERGEQTVFNTCQKRAADYSAGERLALDVTRCGASSVQSYVLFRTFSFF